MGLTPAQSVVDVAHADVRHQRAGKNKKASQKNAIGGVSASLFEPSTEAADHKKIVGMLVDIRHHKPDSSWGIFILSDEHNARHVVTGVLESPRIGMDVAAYGVYDDHPKYGRQFIASVMVEPLPESDAWGDRDRVRRAISSLNHMTDLRFSQLWDKYGEGLRTHMLKVEDVLSAITKPATLSRAHAEEMVAEFANRGRFDRLHLFIAEMGGGQGIVKKIIQARDEKDGVGKWDVDAVIATYRKDPYELVNIKGLGFLTVDVMALKMKDFHLEHPKRLRAALLYVLSEMVTGKGNTAIPAEQWASEASGESVLRITGSDNLLRIMPRLKEHAEELMHENKVAVYAHQEDGQMVLYVADYWVFQSERSIALHLRQKLRRSGGVMDAGILASVLNRSKLSTRQKSAVETAMAHRVGVLTGGPGTGKTTCVEAIIHAAQDMGIPCVLCAPTGKAASRLSDVTGCRATTIHSLIGKTPEGVAKYNEANPHPAKLFIVDEASMIDTDLMSSLISALSVDAGILLVGDVRQLPSVGPGQVLSDIVASRWFPVGVLTENFRQGEDQHIPNAADLVANGQFYGLLSPWSVNIEPKSLSGYHGYAMDDGSGDAMIAGTVLQEVTRMVRMALKRGVPADDIQVLTPMRQRELGVRQLNFQLHGVLNPSVAKEKKLSFGKAKEGDEAWSWRVGDRVMLTKNQHELGVYNGDVGRIIAVYPSLHALPPVVADQFGKTAANFKPFMVARFKVPADGVAVEKGGAVSENDSWYLDVQVDQDLAKHMEPAYAMTIHKTQGSEYPLVILVMHTQHWVMANRSLLYTGMTRAKKGLIVIGTSKAVRRAVTTQGNTRTTLLLKIMSSENA